MPLHDHFRPPLSDVCSWESFHSTWANEIVRHLNKHRLPSGFVARPHVKLGVQVETDVAAWENAETRTPPDSVNGGVATAVWAPTRPTLVAAVDFASPDLFEVRIHRGAMELAAAIELVSPRNKDRPAARRAFAIKCASYLRQGVSVVVVDVVTERTVSLQAELMELLDLDGANGAKAALLSASAYRTITPDEPSRLEGWVEALALGAPLPTLPLWLDFDLVIPLELEETYRSAFDTLQIDE